MKLVLPLLFTLLLPPAPLAADPWTLPAAIEYALRHNPDAALAGSRLAAAGAMLQQANAAFWPQLAVQSSYMRTNNPLNVFGAILNQRAFSADLDFNDVPDADNLNVKGMVTLPLFHGGRNLAGRRAALSMERAARHEAAAVRAILAFEVARAYFTIQKTREFIKAATAAVHSFEGNLTAARRRLAQNTILKAEELDLDVQLARAQEELIRARNASQLALRALRGLLGLEEDSREFDVAPENPVLHDPAIESPVERPELWALQQAVAAAQSKLQQAQAGYLPRLSAFSSAEYNRGWKFDRDGTSYTAGAMADWDIWNGSLTAGRVREARAGLESAQEQLRKTKIALDLEHEQARLNLGEARERVQVTAKAVVHAADREEYFFAEKG